MTSRLALPAVCWAVVAGCAGPPGGEDIGRARVAVVRGEASPAGTADDGVVLLHAVVESGEFICGGALVAPNLVMTARHCVSYLAGGLFRCTVQGELVDNPGGAGTLGLHFPADSIEIFGSETPRTTPLARSLKIMSTFTPSICVNDIAFVLLDKPLALPLLPMRIGRPAKNAESVTLVGYGTGEFLKPNDSFDFRTAPRARKADLSIAAVGPDSIADGVTTTPPRTLLQLGPSGCVGDSGAPLLAAETNAVLGVYSLLDGDVCDAPNARNFFVHVPPFTDLIAQAFAAAGASPTLEPVTDIDASDGAVETGADAEGDATGAGDEPDAEPPAPPPADSSGCAVSGPGGGKGSGWLVSLFALLAAMGGARGSSAAAVERIGSRRLGARGSRS